jgi:hypothetical protein
MTAIVHTKLGAITVYYKDKFELLQLRETAERRGYRIELVKEYA